MSDVKLLPIAGWYVDPLDSSGSTTRFWNGSIWTDQTQLKIQPPVGEPFDELDTSVEPFESGIPTMPDSEKKRGLFGGKKDLEEEIAELRELLTKIGIPQRDRLKKEIQQLQTRISSARSEVSQVEAQLIRVSDQLMLQEVGIYQYAHPLQNSMEFKSVLDQIDTQTKLLVKSKVAVKSVSSWTVNGSEKEGAKMVRDISKLMLRAYVAEADNCIRSLKPSTREMMIQRLEKTKSTIANLGKVMQIQISDEFHDLKIQEIRTTADFLKKKEEEREEEKEVRARLREEEKVAKEIAAQKAMLEKEKQKYVNALLQMQQNESQVQDEQNLQGIQDMQQKLAEIDAGLSGLVERAANTRAGHVYVISNIGAFGNRVVKIGMTRRLDPVDRVKELSDASVPFNFGVHALFFSDDAVGLETSLHHRFSDKRVNLVNMRREFFYVTPIEVREALSELDGHILEFTEQPEAEDFHQSEGERLKLLPPATS